MEVAADEKKTRGENSDRISNLPDSLLISILSLLNARNVVHTRILSKRWHNLWAFVPSLHFDFAEFGGEVQRFNNFVSSFLSLRDEASDVHTFTLSYSPPNRTGISDLVGTWIMYALKHNVKDLTVDLYGHPSWTVPCCLFTCDSLEYLHSKHSCAFIELDMVCFPKLRYLSLDGVCMRNVSLQKLLSGCPTLETLSMHRSIVSMNSISFQTVKSLTITDCFVYCCSDSSTLTISAPCLEYIEFVKVKGSGITFKDMSKVTKAKFIRPQDDVDEEYDFDLLSGISGVTVLYVYSVYLEEYLNREVRKCGTFHKLKCLVIGAFCTHCDFDTWSSFLKHCPNLEYLFLLHTDEICEEDHSGEEYSERLKRIEGFSCTRNLRVEIVCCSYFSEDQMDHLTLQITKEIDELQIVSEHKSEL